MFLSLHLLIVFEDWLFVVGIVFREAVDFSCHRRLCHSLVRLVFYGGDTKALLRVSRIGIVAEVGT